MATIFQRSATIALVSTISTIGTDSARGRGRGEFLGARAIRRSLSIESRTGNSSMSDAIEVLPYGEHEAGSQNASGLLLEWCGFQAGHFAWDRMTTAPKRRRSIA